MSLIVYTTKLASFFSSKAPPPLTFPRIQGYSNCENSNCFAIFLKFYSLKQWLYIFYSDLLVKRVASCRLGNPNFGPYNLLTVPCGCAFLGIINSSIQVESWETYLLFDLSP